MGRGTPQLQRFYHAFAEWHIPSRVSSLAIGNKQHPFKPVEMFPPHPKHILGPHTRILHDEDHIVQGLGSCCKELRFGLGIDEDIPATLL